MKHWDWLCHQLLAWDAKKTQQRLREKKVVCLSKYTTVSVLEVEYFSNHSRAVLTTNYTNHSPFQICIWWFNADSSKYWAAHWSQFECPWAKGLLVVMLLLLHVWVNFSREPSHLGISSVVFFPLSDRLIGLTLLAFPNILISLCEERGYETKCRG